MDFIHTFKCIAAGSALALLCGCDLTQDMAIDKGKEMVASALKDPGSAEFQGVFMVEEKVIGETHYGFLCGAVNSRNSFGGYTGFQRFVANFNYSRKGQIGVSYVTVEEGAKARLSPEGISYFQTVYWLGKCEERPQKAEILSDAAIEVETWAVQVASISDERKAEHLKEDLGAKGFTSYLTRKDGMSRVFVGPLPDRDQATAVAAEILKKISLNGFVVRVYK